MGLKARNSIIENIKDRFKKITKILFVENQFVKPDERDNLMASIVEARMSKEIGSHLVQTSDKVDKSGEELNKAIDNSVREDGKDYRTDSTIENITNGVKSNVKNENVKVEKTERIIAERDRDDD